MWICVAISFGNIDVAKGLDERYNIKNGENYGPLCATYFCESQPDELYDDEYHDVYDESWGQRYDKCYMNPFILAVELCDFDMIEYYLDNYKVDQKILNISVKHLNMRRIMSESLHNNKILPLLNRILNSIKTDHDDEDEDYCDIGKFKQFVNNM